MDDGYLNAGAVSGAAAALAYRTTAVAPLKITVSSHLVVKEDWCYANAVFLDHRCDGGVGAFHYDRGGRLKRRKGHGRLPSLNL